MNAASNQPQVQPVITARQLARAILFFVVFSAVVFVTAGKIDWWEGWAYLTVAILSQFVGRMHLARVHPDLIRERASYDEHTNVPTWDRWLMPLVAIIGPLATLITAGLDERFGWSGNPVLWMQVVALAGILLCTAFGHWATISNQFFGAVSRIQSDRGQYVVDTGPYLLVRHPAYAAAIVLYLAMPLMLGSWWANIPAGITIVAYIVRTALEDRMLRRELAGYQDYAQRTRYRLLPGVW